MTRTLEPRPDQARAGTSTVDAIAFLVWQIRPDWDEHLVRTVLYSHAQQVAAGDLARAALAAAANPNLPRPAAIGWRGPHWDGLATCPPDVVKPLRCGVCGRLEPECWSVRPAGRQSDDHDFEPVRS